MLAEPANASAREHPVDFSVTSKEGQKKETSAVMDLSMPRQATEKVKRKGKAPCMGWGWLQINNTLVPYVRPVGSEHQLLPVSVLRNAANLDVQLGQELSRKSTEEESGVLNQCCRRAGVSFTFVKHTKLVTLKALQALVKPGTLMVRNLPPEDPFGHAIYHDDRPVPNLQHMLRLPLPPPMHMGPVQMTPMTPPYQPFTVLPQGPVQDLSPRLQVPTTHLMTARQGPSPRHPTLSIPKNTPVNPSPAPAAPKQRRRRSTTEAWHIRPLLVNGRPISCLVDGPHSFALLEAVSRIFYPESSLPSVQYAMEKVLQIPTRKITAQQEKAFIAFYKLPTKRLHCRIMVDVLLIAENLNNIKIVLKETDRMQRTDEQHKLQQATNENTQSKEDAQKEAALPSDIVGTGVAEAASKVAASAPTVLKQLNQPPVSARNRGKKRSLEDMVSRLKSAR